MRNAAAGTVAVFLAGAAWGQDLELGKRAFDAGRYAEAARLFESARRTDPACPIAFYLGMARYRVHEMDAALIAFAEAANCDPKLTLAHIAMGDAYAERGNQGEAMAAYERALALEPGNPEALRGAAAIYTRARLDAKAAGALEELLKVEPRDARAHADLGAAYFATGNEAGSEKEFAAALRINPNLAAALLGQSNLLIRQGDEEKAVATLRKAIALAPRAFEPRFILGSALNRAGRFVEAAEQLEAAIRLGGTEPEIYFHLARAYGGLGRTEERKTALAKFTELTAQGKTESEAQRNAARLAEEAKALVETGNLTEAFSRMEQARDLRPLDDTVLFRLASLGYDTARYDQARKAIQKAISISPSEWLYHFLLGLIEGRGGNLAASRASLETALRLNPGAADARAALAEVVQRENQK